MSQELEQLLLKIRKCTICEAHLPLRPKPVLRASTKSKIAIIGQAPGTRVHKTGIPWNDPSGDKLREWLNMDRSLFYDEDQIAIIPMGFCYPGKGKSGDLPPRPECAPEWHEQLFKKMPSVKLFVLAGSYAVRYYLPEFQKQTLVETIKFFIKNADSKFIPLVHPSPRNRIWLQKNPWFEKSYIPRVRERIGKS
ncbi:uracil-DNA glycosylase family protein [Hyphobacterium sp. CCMP332]|nr:uracil-DNA glycosylase family protein [Hyphobacterium sp. CCMP332]